MPLIVLGDYLLRDVVGDYVWYGVQMESRTCMLRSDAYIYDYQ